MKLFRRYPSVLASLLMSAGMGGCTTSSYMGIALAPGAVEPAIQELALRARSGDKHAQLDLGIAFEEGVLVQQDRARAIKLYDRASRTTSAVRWFYAPSPGGGASAVVLPTDAQLSYGLSDARERLNRITKQ